MARGVGAAPPPEQGEATLAAFPSAPEICRVTPYACLAPSAQLIAAATPECRTHSLPFAGAPVDL